MTPPLHLRELTGISFILAWMLLSGCNPASVKSPQSPAASSGTSEHQYKDILGRVITLDSGESFSGFSMSTEHLFVEDPDLRNKIFVFDRTPGNLDFLFDRINRPEANPRELLAVAQMLVFYAEWQDDSDRLVVSTDAPTLLKSINGPQFLAAERSYPDAGISRIVKEACEKVIQRHQVLLG